MTPLLWRQIEDAPLKAPLLDFSILVVLLDRCQLEVFLAITSNVSNISLSSGKATNNRAWQVLQNFAKSSENIFSLGATGKFLGHQNLTG